MSISQQLQNIWNELPPQTRLVAVSKFHSPEDILEAYRTGQRIFGESKAQELTEKHKVLPQDIEWHYIGHLQTNKVRYITPFVDIIHSVDSLRVLQEINRCALLNNRNIKILLQIHIAKEETKYGFSYEECYQFLNSEAKKEYENVIFAGLMGMATFTDDMRQIKKEYAGLASFFKKVKIDYFSDDPHFKELSMGMSDDYKIAVEEGSTMVRIGSKVFGSRV
jgi:pyridoxal phosphate enzyme (YggS family)